MSIDRRQFLRSVGGVASTGALAGASTNRFTVAPRKSLPEPDESGIEHIVLVMMENRSFDHFLGWLPGANGHQAGLTYLDSNGEAHPTDHLTTFVGCSHPDPDHSYSGGRSEYDDGKMDGWLRTTTNDSFSIGYYVEDDLPFFGALARNFTTLDNYFASIMAPTFPNRIFQHAAQTDRTSNTLDISTLPTIWDHLESAGVTHKYYYSNVPFLALWGLKYLSMSAMFSDFQADAANGTLPAISFLDPKFTILDDGAGNDDHPHADVRNGEAFLAKVYKSLTEGPDWKSTVLIINRDEWGGFYDTVVPPRVIAPNDVDRDLVDGKALLGCRVPVLLVSPFSRGTNPTAPRIDTTLYDHTSVLKLIEWRFGLAPLTTRDASSEIGNVAQALDFTSPHDSVPVLPAVHPPLFTIPCGLFELGSTIDNESYDFFKLLISDLMKGWKL